MRNKVFGGLGMLWGGAIVVRWFLTDAQSMASGSYGAGQWFGVLFASGMFVVGLYHFRKQSIS